jgi:hypothetical protein
MQKLNVECKVKRGQDVKREIGGNQKKDYLCDRFLIK